MMDRIEIECPHCRWVGYHCNLLKNEIAYFCPACKSIISLREDYNIIKNGYINISGDLTIEFPIQIKDLKEKYNLSKTGEIKILDNKIIISNFKINVSNLIIAVNKILDYSKQIIDKQKFELLKLINIQYKGVKKCNTI